MLSAMLVEMTMKENKGKDGLVKGKGLVLVVDDEPIMRKIAVNVMQNSGYQVLVAESGKLAIEIFKQYQPKIKLVLLDLLMPEISGSETFREMKKIHPDVNVLLVSGAKSDKRIQVLLAQGAKGFVEKPYTFPQLSRAAYDAIYTSLPDFLEKSKKIS